MTPNLSKLHRTPNSKARETTQSARVGVKLKSLYARDDLETAEHLDSLPGHDPMNNIVRTTIEAMAGVFGGTQSMHTNSFDEAIGLPSDSAARVARNTQLILQEESGITRVVDPWGGSYFMENLTHQMIEQVDALIEEVESFGGMAKAIGIGLPKLRIEESATIEQARIDRGERTIVGVNKYQSKQTDAPETVRVDAESVGKIQRERLRLLRLRRDNDQVAQTLQSIREAALTTNVNLVPLAIDAMRCGATVGEVSSALESVWGRHTDESLLVSGVYDANRHRELGRVSRRRLDRCFDTIGRPSNATSRVTWQFQEGEATCAGRRGRSGPANRESDSGRPWRASHFWPRNADSFDRRRTDFNCR